MSLATRIPVIAADVVVTAVTWAKTSRAYRAAYLLNIRESRVSLITVLFRDGATQAGTLFFSSSTDGKSHRNDVLSVSLPDTSVLSANQHITFVTALAFF